MKPVGWLTGADAADDAAAAAAALLMMMMLQLVQREREDERSTFDIKLQSVDASNYKC